MIRTLKQKLAKRQDLLTIADMLPSGVRILDLGCGDGSFLKLVREDKNIRGLGVEISQSQILECAANGVHVVNYDLDEGLRMFNDKSFDYVILSQTLQALKRPDLILDEMLRVGCTCIVSFINIGFINSRIQLAFTGRMPVTKTIPYPWYATPNIHLGTIKDFKSLCSDKGIKIIREAPVSYQRLNPAAWLMPNLFASTCVFVLTKES